MNSSTNALDLTKPVQTRDGRKARIICSDMNGRGVTIVALISGKDGIERPQTYFTTGSFFGSVLPSEADLQNIPEVTRVLVFSAPLAMGGVGSVVLNGLNKAAEDALITRKKDQGLFLKIIEVELDI